MARANRLRLSFLALGPFLLPAADLAAQDGDTFDRTPKTCIATQSIDRTEVLDDRTILFYMRGSKVYRNYLPKKCPGLERENRFAYRTTSGRLCDIDTLTVLEQWGGRLTPGFTCPLGDFHPVTKEEAEELAREPDEVHDAIQTEAVELPPADEAPAPETPPAAAAEE